MSKYEFLARLESLLAQLEPTERTEVLRYYEEYFEDNADAAQTLGTPESIAKDLLESYGIPADAPQRKKKTPFLPARLIGGILLTLLALLLGSIAFGTICAAVVLLVIGCMLFSFHVAIAATVLGAAIITLGLFGLSLGGTIKMAYAAARLFKTCKGGAVA